MNTDIQNIEENTTVNTNTESTVNDVENVTDTEEVQMEEQQASAGSDQDLNEEVVAQESDQKAEATENKKKVREQQRVRADQLLLFAQQLAGDRGLDAEQQKGFLKIENKNTGHKLYVATNGAKAETTLPRDLLGEFGEDLKSRNGRIEARVKVDEKALEVALDALSSHAEKIRSPQRNA